MDLAFMDRPGRVNLRELRLNGDNHTSKRSTFPPPRGSAPMLRTKETVGGWDWLLSLLPLGLIRHYLAILHALLYQTNIYSFVFVF